MSVRRIIGFVLLAVAAALLIWIVPEIRNTFTFFSPRKVSYHQPYDGHALLLILGIVGTVASFLGGLFLIGISRKNR